MDKRTNIPKKLQDNLQRLERLLRSYGSVALGFSGGVDSTFLAAVCARCMPDRALLVHLDTPLIGSPERNSFTRGAQTLGLPVESIAVNQLENEAVAANPVDRCYHCKLAGFTRILDVARERGYDVVIDGSNADDAGDYRPGMKAVEELGVRSPLMETGWHKQDERELLRAWGIPAWNLAPGACLATRIPCGEALTAQKLDVIRACEDYLHGLGLQQVRVRLEHGRARVSAAPEDLQRLAALAVNGDETPATVTEDGVPLPAAIADALLARGASQVDPLARPYVHGAMNGTPRQ